MQCSLCAFLGPRGAPKLTSLQLKVCGYEQTVSPERVLAALPPLHNVADLSIVKQRHVLCDVYPNVAVLGDLRVLRAILLACPALRQLRIHSLTSNSRMLLNACVWRHMFQDDRGGCCLPRSSLRRLELSSAPSSVTVVGHLELGFPSLTWLPELVLRSRTIHVGCSDTKTQTLLYPGPSPKLAIGRPQSNLFHQDSKAKLTYTKSIDLCLLQS